VWIVCIGAGVRGLAVHTFRFFSCWLGSYSWICTTLPCVHIAFFMFPQADPSGCTVWGVDLRPFACWECGFKSHQGHGCLSLVDIFCYQVEVSALGCSVDQRNPPECGVSNECYCKTQ
jgi:hypothetical protein